MVFVKHRTLLITIHTADTQEEASGNLPAPKVSAVNIHVISVLLMLHLPFAGRLPYSS
jgi:hypothetical protein